MIYVDNAATTMLEQKVLEKMMPYLTEYYGNASSIYTFGQQAKEVVNESRETIAKCLNADAKEIYFTSGGTESDNWAIKGVADALSKKGNHIITSAIEHHAILHTCEFLEKHGYEVTYLPVDENGLVNPDDLEKAITIVNNAKTSRPSVCNAQEVCLVHKNIAEKFLPLLKSELVEERIKNNLIPVELRLDEKSAKIIEGTYAGENDFDTEFLDYILAVKVVDSPEEAILHILEHSTGHSEGIVTENEEIAEKFVCETDSAAVYVNVSTRFTDGGEFGLGCEMGISTQKLHARGPMGIEELTTYKYIIKGNGQVR